jgi:hypothetical protein
MTELYPRLRIAWSASGSLDRSPDTTGFNDNLFYVLQRSYLVCLSSIRFIIVAGKNA